MSVKLVELNQDIIGKKLGKSLFNTKGNRLLGEGAEITSFHFSHLTEIGYKSIYIINNQSIDFEMNDQLVSERMLAKTPYILRNIFNRFMGKDKISIFETKKELHAVAEQLLKDVEPDRQNALALLDLKRSEDYFYQHSLNVAIYSILIGSDLCFRQSKILDLTLAALLHDIGMLEIDKAILNKPAELSDSEYTEIKKHTILGFHRLGRHCSYGGLITIAAVQHHERYDGSGYPNKLSSDEIHEYSQIVSLADFFDAYTSDRPYRRLHSIEEALKYIKENEGHQFAPKIVETFLTYF